MKLDDVVAVPVVPFKQVLDEILLVFFAWHQLLQRGIFLDKNLHFVPKYLFIRVACVNFVEKELRIGTVRGAER
jgi:hypothetical protein